MKSCNKCGVELTKGNNWGVGAMKNGNNICLKCNAEKSRRLWAAGAPARAESLAKKLDAIANISCECCGVSFKPKITTAKYCSMKCQQRARYIKNPYNKDTFGTGTTANRGRRQTEEHVRKRAESAAMSLAATTRTCVKCGDCFTPTMAAQKYCSGRCWQSVAKAKKERKSTVRIHKDHYKVLFDLQNGKCKICGADSGSNGRGDKLAVDHCHATGHIRGLLCHKCNTALGLMQDSTETLQAAINYLIEAQSRA